LRDRRFAGSGQVVSKCRHIAVFNDAREAGNLRQAERSLLRTFTRRCGAYLALAGLALQLALSFGHLHARDISPSGLTFAKARSAEASIRSPSYVTDDEDLCPICFSGLLLSTSFVPDAPQPPVAFEFERIDCRLANPIDIVAETRRRPFQSRAPPLA
jgi:hypothetical protein